MELPRIRPIGSFSMGEYLASVGIRPDGISLLDRGTPTAYTAVPPSVTAVAGPPSPRLKAADARTVDRAVGYLRQVDPPLFSEVWQHNAYKLAPADIEGRTVVDLGSNIGLFTALALHLGAASVTMVEPSAELWAHATASGLLEVPGLRIIRAAAGNTGRVRLQGAGSATQTVPEADGPVPSLTLQELVPEINGPAVLKIDTEGAEYRILYGAPPELIQRFEVILMEVHDTKENPRGSKELPAYLLSLGFVQIWKEPLYAWSRPDRSDIRLLQPEVCMHRFNRVR